MNKRNSLVEDGGKFSMQTDPEFVEHQIKKEVAKLHQDTEEKKVVVPAKRINHVGVYHKLHSAKIRKQGEIK